MYKATIIFLLCLPCICCAQVPKVNMGLSVPLYIKFNPLSGEDVYKRLFRTVGIDAVLQVNGMNETDMSFLLSAGILSDRRRFNADLDTRLVTNLYFFNLNPSVLIKSKWPHINYNLGIGALVNMGQDIGIYSYSSMPYWHANTTLEEVEKTMKNNSRSVIPFVTLGVSVDIKKHYRLQCSLQPTLMNFYESGTTVYFRSSTTDHDFVMDYQPVYFGLKLFYFMYPNVN